MNESPKNSQTDPPETGPPPSVLSDDAVEMIAAVFRTIGDATRIRLMEALNEQGSATGSGLAERLGLTQQAVSKQLASLHQAGIVGRRRDKAWVHYELIDWTPWWLVEQIGAAITASDEN